MKKKIFTLLATLWLTTSLMAQTPEFEWAVGMGGSDVDVGFSVTVDPFGNVYTSGYFEGTVDFDPGSGIYNLSSNGGNDIFISKLDATGNFVWAKAIGGSYNDRGNSIALDTFGNIYITGYFKDTVDFDPGSGIYNLSSNGSFDIFISKLDASGNFIWAKAMGGSNNDFGFSIVLDASGNVYTIGIFMDTADFDPGSGFFNLISNGGYDNFISKIDFMGNFIWAKAIGGSSSYDRANSIAIDASGNVYTTGYYWSIVDFDPGNGIYNLNSFGDGSIFILKFDASGNFIWVKAMGGGSNDRGISIAIESTGNIYTTGYFNGTYDFDPGSGIYNLISNGGNDIFISKLDASGNFVWAKAMGGSSSDQGNSIALDAIGNVYTTGYFGGTTDFDPGSGLYNLSSNGSEDIFISKLDASGNFVWAKAMGSSNSDQGNSIALDASGNIYTTGYFQSSADFDPCSGTYNLSSNGAHDVFILKLSQYLLANFTASETIISLGDTIQFTDLSIGNPTSWLWDFGDGTSDTLQNPIVVYNSVGLFDVELIIGDGITTDTLLIEEYITVNDTSTIGVITNIQNPGSNFELFQNIPNPFTGKTEISFYLTKDCGVEIEIFNLLGERIVVETRHALSLPRIPTTLPKGRHSITFNSNNLPAGPYYYRLKTEGFEQTKKMVVIK